MSTHIVLLGDSIFDNASYTRGEPDVHEHLRAILPPGVSSSLLAVDGSTTADMKHQVARLPRDVTHAVVSIGGNDALANVDILDQPVRSTRQALLLFEGRVSRFEDGYRDAIAIVAKRVAHPTVCTIYNGNLPGDQAGPARIALMLFNDVVLRVAFELRLAVIDLRLICVAPSDYANPIEPSGRGGAKIARAIARRLGYLDGGSPLTTVFAG